MSRIGVFVCHCGTNIAGTVDVEAVAEAARQMPNVVYAGTNKYMCSAQGQDYIVDLVKEHNLDRVVIASCSPRMHERLFRKGLFPAGRLDKDTTGFVLLTDDGAFAHDILSPKKHIPKTYHALVDGPITEQMERDFAQGIRIGPDQTLPASLKKLSSCERGDWGEVILREGLYHQIKRMFGVYGLKVLELKRVKMGRLPLDPTLKEGECRELTPEELRLVASREEE